MPRRYELVLQDERRIRRTPERIARLERWLRESVDDALSARYSVEQTWKNALKRYNVVPKSPIKEKHAIVEGAPNVVVPIGAIACEQVAGHMFDLIHNTDPIVTIREVAGGKWRKHAEALQMFMARVSANDLNFHRVSEHLIMDDCILGTAVVQVPIVRSVVRHKATRIIHEGPRFYYTPVEDFIVPSGTLVDIHDAEWVALRKRMSRAQLNEAAKANGWDLAGVQHTSHLDDVAYTRQMVAGNDQQTQDRDWFEILQVYANFDWDGDGEAESVLITADRTSGVVLDVRWNPFGMRPFEVLNYQTRAGSVYGMGIMEMLAPMQDEATDLHNNHVLNSLLVNCRVWQALDGAVDRDVEIFPGAVVPVRDPNGLKPLPMADVFPSAFTGEAIVRELARERSGAPPQPGPAGGNRVPATTAVTMQAGVNRRFSMPFMNAGEAIARAHIQALARYHEMLMRGNRFARQFIEETMGERALLVLELLQRNDFIREVVVELTATSATTSREAEKQAIFTLNQLFMVYYEKAFQALQIAVQVQGTPLADIAVEIVKKGTEMMRRTAHLFPEIKDPEAFILEVPDGLGGNQAPSNFEGQPGPQQDAGGVAGGAGQDADFQGALVPDMGGAYQDQG